MKKWTLVGVVGVVVLVDFHLNFHAQGVLTPCGEFEFVGAVLLIFSVSAAILIAGGETLTDLTSPWFHR